MELIDIKSFKKKAKIRYILNLVLVLLFLALVAAGLVLSLLLSKLDYTLNLVLNIVVSVVVVILAIFYFANIFPIITHYYKFYKNMHDVNLEHRRSRTFVEELENKNINYVNYRVLLFSYMEGEKEYRENLYVLDNDVSFVKEHNYKLATYHNVIIKCEDLENAKI